MSALQFWGYAKERLKNVRPCPNCWKDPTGKIQIKLQCAAAFSNVGSTAVEQQGPVSDL